MDQRGGQPQGDVGESDSGSKGSIFTDRKHREGQGLFSARPYSVEHTSAATLLRAGNTSTVEKAKEALREGAAATDARVEKELLEYACKEYFDNLESYYFGKYQSKMQDRFGNDYKAMAEYLWSKSVISSAKRIEDIQSIDDVKKDPLRLFLTDTPIMTLQQQERPSQENAGCFPP